MAEFGTSSGNLVSKAEPRVGTFNLIHAKMVIGTNLATRVSVPPYLRDTYDKEAVIQGIDFIRSALSKVSGLTWVTPTASQTTTAFVNSVSPRLQPTS
jgi:cellobiose dehydrogenase (acceptor)